MDDELRGLGQLGNWSAGTAGQEERGHRVRTRAREREGPPPTKVSASRRPRGGENAKAGRRREEDAGPSVGLPSEKCKGQKESEMVQGGSRPKKNVAGGKGALDLSGKKRETAGVGAGRAR